MDEQQFDMPKMPNMPKNMGRMITIGIIVIVVLILGSTSFYTVQEQEKAAILTFGKYTSTSDAGLHLKMPYPIQQVVKVPANITQRIEIGFREENGQTVTLNDEALMITGDENIVSADAVVEWRVGDMESYLYNIEDPEIFLRNSAVAAIRSVIGSQPLDYVITDGKTVVQTQAKEKLDELNLAYNTGIFIQDLKFQDIEPPEGEVQEAFRDVTNAREEKNTKINNARKYENDRIPKARGEAQALIEQAEAEKESRILNATGDVAKFNALYAAYVNNPQVTESRLIIETLETILPNARIFVTDGSGDTVKYLPLNELMNTRSSTTSESTTQPKGSGAQ